MACLSNKRVIGWRHKMKKIHQEKKVSYLDHDLRFRLGLVLLTERMVSQCYSGEKTSEESKRDFFIGVQRLRDEL